MMRPSSIEEFLEKTEVVRKESPENIQVAARLRRDKVIRTLVMEFNTKSSTRDREKKKVSVSKERRGDKSINKSSESRIVKQQPNPELSFHHRPKSSQNITGKKPANNKNQ
jgi:hypothetical protein